MCPLKQNAIFTSNNANSWIKLKEDAVASSFNFILYVYSLFYNRFYSWSACT
jgi:hypothetical protein